MSIPKFASNGPGTAAVAGLAGGDEPGKRLAMRSAGAVPGVGRSPSGMAGTGCSGFVFIKRSRPRRAHRSNLGPWSGRLRGGTLNRAGFLSEYLSDQLEGVFESLTLSKEMLGPLREGVGKHGSTERLPCRIQPQEHGLQRLPGWRIQELRESLDVLWIITKLVRGVVGSDSHAGSVGNRFRSAMRPSRAAFCMSCPMRKRDSRSMMAIFVSASRRRLCRFTSSVRATS